MPLRRGFKSVLASRLSSLCFPRSVFRVEGLGCACALTCTCMSAGGKLLDPRWLDR
jgi:hypothetical protein